MSHVNTLHPKRFLVFEVKMGHGGQGELAGKSGITLDEKKNGVPRGVLSYISYMGMCRCEGYGFQAVSSATRYRNQRVLV